MEHFTKAEKFVSLCANASEDSNITSDLWLVEDKTSGLVTASFLLLFLVVGLPWNLLVVVTIVKEKLYTQPTIILLLNLVLTDVFLLVFLVPFQVAVGIEGEYYVGATDHIRCQTCNVGVINTIFQLTIISNISLMSFDRFLFIYKPLKYEQIITVFRTLLVLALTWILTTVVAILPVIGYGDVIFTPSLLTCSLDNYLSTGKYALVVFLYAILSLIPALVFNIWLSCIVQKNIRAVYNVRSLSISSGGKSSDDDKIYKSIIKQRHQKQLHLVRVFGGLLCVSLITWLPMVIFFLLNVFGLDIPDNLTTAMFLLFTSQVILHPFVQTVLIKEVREPHKKIALCCCMKLKSKFLSDNSSNGCGCYSDGAGSSWSPGCSGCGCYSNSAGSSWSPGCSGCGFLEMCNAAVFLNHPHSSTTNSPNSDGVNSVQVDDFM